MICNHMKSGMNKYLSARQLRARKLRYFEDMGRVRMNLINELIDAHERPNRWRKLPRREGVMLRARQIELLGREREIMQGADILAEWIRDDKATR